MTVYLWGRTVFFRNRIEIKQDEIRVFGDGIELLRVGIGILRSRIVKIQVLVSERGVELDSYRRSSDIGTFSKNIKHKV